MKSISKSLGWVVVITLMMAVSAAAKPGYGTLSGVILDPSGTPQMGATVWITSDDAAGRTVSHQLSNQRGTFVIDHLKPGQYSVRVSLAGFLPAMERHIEVAANLTTLLRVQVDSIFASLDTLRRNSDVSAEPDDWKWVLRSSAATRTVLQLLDSDVSLASNTLSADSLPAQRPRGLMQLTSGASRPGSPSNLSDSPATAMSYDQRLGAAGRLLLAGQMSYERGASGAFASVWLPSGEFGRGPETTLVMRQAKIGPDGLAFHGLRLDHSEQLALSDHLSLRAGAEYLRAGIISTTSALRPHAQFDASLSPNWTASFIFAAAPADSSLANASALQSAITELDSLPPVLFRNGNPVFAGGWHQELSVRHKLTARSSIEAATFHDSARHQAVFGSGQTTSPDFFQDAFSSAFLYDGGETKSWGSRVAYHHKISSDVDFSAIYAWAGALSPAGELNTTESDLRDSFATHHHHSVAARISGTVPHSGTHLTASYKWIAGTTLSRLDTFGESAYQIDPYLHVSIRQPLPGFGTGGHWEALADFSNVLAQGYVPVTGQDNRVTLVPVLRSFRGGVSFQF